jgi:hypothetical protein
VLVLLASMRLASRFSTPCTQHLAQRQTTAGATPVPALLRPHCLPSTALHQPEISVPDPDPNPDSNCLAGNDTFWSSGPTSVPGYEDLQ